MNINQESPVKKEIIMTNEVLKNKVMSNRSSVSRRHFIGASMLALCIPSKLFAGDERKVVLRFAAMSDVHFEKSAPANARQPVRFEKALRFMNEFSAGQKYPKFDALAVAGDFSNHGVIEEIGYFRKKMDENLKPETRRVLCMGNHEFYGGDKKLWEKTFETEANRHQIINGIHFITISPEKGTCAENDYIYALDWFEKELNDACAADPKKPVFVIQHYHVHSTVFGSYNLPGDFPAGVHDLKKVLEKHPQVVHISGHSHVPSVDPRCCWQGEFTAFGTGSMSYFGLYDSVFDYQHGAQINVNEAGTFLVFEVYEDNGIRVRLYDVISESFLDREYVICDPADLSKFVYTKKRFETAKKPVWPSDAKIRSFDSDAVGAIVEFTQAKDDLCVSYYHFVIEKFENEKWKKYTDEYAWSDFFMKKPSEKLTVDLAGLPPNTKIRVKVYAVNAFQKETEEPLAVEFVTATRPDDSTIDRDSLTPVANFINLAFNENEAVNKPANNAVRSKPKKIGEPKIVKDPFLGYATLLSGKDECWQVPVREKNYGLISFETTIGVRFRMETGKKTEDSISVFGNTEWGGMGIEVDPKKKTLSFHCFINNGYKGVTAPCDCSKDTVAFGVYDGKNIILYLNGKEVARKKQTGRIRYTRNKDARAFCAGADITPHRKGRYFLPGLISFARVYSWALTSKQIAALSIQK